MSKVHTRIKRKYNLSRFRSHTNKLRTTKRPKTFKTEESAKKWAENNNIKNYELINLKNPENKLKKIKISIK